MSERSDPPSGDAASSSAQGGSAASAESGEKASAHQALRESEERLRALVDATSDVVYRMNADWTEIIELDGRGFIADTQQPRRNWIDDYIFPEDQRFVMAAVEEAIRTKSVFQLEHRVRRVDGSAGWTFSRATPLTDADGNVTEWFGMASDVTARRETEQALRDQAEELQTILDAVPAAIWVARDPACLDIGGNSVARELLRMSDGGQMSKSAPGAPSHFKIFGPDGTELAPDQLPVQVAARGQEVRAFEERIEFADGSSIDLIGNAVPLTDAAGKARGAVAAFVDVTDRKRIEEALRDSEARFRTLFEAIDVGFCIIEVEFDGDGRAADYRFVETNPAFQKQTGLQDAEGKTARELVPDLEEHWFETYGRVARTGQAERFENGSVPMGRWFDVYAFPAGGEPGQNRVAILFTDISDRRLMEENLRESEARYREVFEHAGVGMIEIDSQWQILRSNSAYAQIAGRSVESLEGVSCLEFTHPDDIATSKTNLRRVGSGEQERVSFEKRYVRPNGEIIWVRSNLALTGGGNDGRRFLKVVEDITGEKEAREELRERSEEFYTLADNIPSLAWMAYADGHIFWYNRRWYDYTGTTPDSQEGWGWESVHHPDTLPAVVERWKHAIATGERFEMTFPLKGADGLFRPFLTRIVPIRDERGEIVRWFGTNVDVSDQIAAEGALRDESQTLETLNRTGAALAAELDLESVVQLVTDAGVELTGAQFGAFFYNVRERRGDSYLLYALSGVDRSAFEKFPMPRKTAIFGPTFEGTEVVRSADITKDARYGKSRPYNGMPEGHLPVVSYLAVPVISRSGEVIGGLFFGHHEEGRFTDRHERLMLGVAAQAAVAMDNARLYQDVQKANETLEQRVHERTVELAQANEALRQAQKMEAIGQLTGGIAHDFNNMLTVVRGSADILRRPDLDPSKRARYVDAIAETADRAARLTGQLLAFARRQALQPTVFDAIDRIRSIADMLRTILGSRISLEISADCEQCFIEADPTQFETALVNMTVNARDAMNGEGELSVRLSTVEALPLRLQPADGPDFVAIEVRDTGEGIDPDNLTKIFEPFFTTKEVGKGTGLGLSQVYGFAKQSGGEIDVRSEIGAGTTFTLYLPEVAAPPATEEEEQVVPERLSGGRVLVVEDNEDVGEFAESVLAELGYQVERATNAADALRILEGSGGFDVVFTDVVMPGMSGVEFARELRERWPELPVVLTSGYSHVFASQPGLDFPLLQKPYSLDALQRTLDDALQR